MKLTPTKARIIGFIVVMLAVAIVAIPAPKWFMDLTMGVNAPNTLANQCVEHRGIPIFVRTIDLDRQVVCLAPTTVMKEWSQVKP